MKLDEMLISSIVQSAVKQDLSAASCYLRSCLAILALFQLRLWRPWLEIPPGETRQDLPLPSRLLYSVRALSLCFICNVPCTFSFEHLQFSPDTELQDSMSGRKKDREKKN
jgi:hypothetical protein